MHDMPLYEIQYTDETQTNPMCIYKTDIGLWIPMDENNADYRKYLLWLSDTNI